jgi:1-acyl-sn-glycerol-3-phosphate acyltransferase
MSMKKHVINQHNVADEVRQFIYSTFSRVIIDGPDLSHLSDSKNTPVMAVCTHRSQTDYFIAGYVMHNQGIKNIRIAAGDNLTTLPVIGKKFRSLGAFSIKRNAGFYRSYIRKLGSKVSGMLLDGDNILVFPEAGRSYGGNMMDIKGGLITAALAAQRRDSQKAIQLLPMAISYEYLPELRQFALLKKGKALRKSAKNVFTKFLGTLLYFGADIIAFSSLFIKKRFGLTYGEIAIDYGDPIPLSQYCQAEKKGSRPDEEYFGNSEQLDRITKDIARLFNALYRLYPMHVVASILSNTAKPVQLSQLEPMIEPVVTGLQEKGTNVKALVHLTSKQIMDTGILQLRRIGAIAIRNKTVHFRRPDIVKYYAAACR